MRFAVSLAYFERAKGPRLAHDRKDEVDGGRLEVSRQSHRNVHLLASFSRGSFPFEIVKYKSAHTPQSF